MNFIREISNGCGTKQRLWSLTEEEKTATDNELILMADENCSLSEAKERIKEGKVYHFGGRVTRKGNIADICVYFD